VLREMDRPAPSPTDPGPDLKIEAIDPKLYNRDLAPIKMRDRRWGWFEIWNVWSNTAQSLLGYTLAASLFLTYGLNGWAVFAALVLAGLIVMVLVNLSGQPSVKYGIPYPVMARASMGVHGANLPAMIRAIVAIFWYGAQTYVASTAISLLITSIGGAGIDDGTKFLGLTTIGWVSFVIVWSFQVVLFWNGIEWLRTFLNWTGPGVYAVMLTLMAILWVKAGSGLLTEVGTIFQGTGSYRGGSVGAFLAIVGTMIAFYAPVILNYGDFSRYVRTRSAMRKGNLLGLPLNIAFFAFIALFVTGGTAVVFGERLTSPTDIVSRVGSLPLTIVAALTFVAATVGINVVANFVPPANDLSNLLPSRISFRSGGIIASIVAFFIGALDVSIISRFGISQFVNTLGAVLAPAYGIMIADYYLIKRGALDVQQLFSSDKRGAYHYVKGWNRNGLIAMVVAAIFSVLAVWLPALDFLIGFDWLIGAALGGAIYFALMRRAAP
jgi:nucleobase:cation symporter-1, NCS1 family